MVYRCGLRAPKTESADLIDEQMRAAHRYANKLREIEREFRAAARKLDVSTPRASAAFHARREVEERLTELINKAKKERSAGRSRTAVSESLKSAIAATRDERREAQMEFAAAIRESRKMHEAELETARLTRRGHIKAARAASGVYWGTYELVDDAFEAAARSTPWWDGAEPKDVRFVKWEGEGAVSVRFTGGGLPADDIQEDAGNVRVAPRDDDRVVSLRSSTRRRHHLIIRVGSIGRAPVLASFPMIHHRPFPFGSVVKRVTIHRQMTGPRVEWFATWTIERPPVSCPRDSAVAAHIAWRSVDGRLRVGMIWDGEAFREIVLPDEIRAGFTRAETLRSTRDNNQNAMAEDLRLMLRSVVLPKEFIERTETMAQWRSAARFAALAIWWRDHRFAGDDEAITHLEAWRRQDKHLWNWESSQRTKSLRRRKDFYRCIGAELAERHGVLVVDDFDLAKFARTPEVDEDDDRTDTYARHRTMACTHSLRDALAKAFRARGGRVVKIGRVTSANLTRTCAKCGADAEPTPTDVSREVRCSAGHVWDRDENAARNLIALAATAREVEPSKPLRAQRRREAIKRKKAAAEADRSQSASDDAMAS